MSIATLKRSIRQLDLANHEPFLLVAWRDRQNLKVATVRLHASIQQPLRDICVHALQSIANRQMRVYDADARLDRAEEGMWVDAARVRSDSVLASAIANVDAAPEVTATEVADASLLFHAIGFLGGEELTLFVRRRLKSVRTGPKMTVGLAGQALRESRQPVLIFDNRIDCIWRNEGIVVFDESAFDGLLREPNDIQIELQGNIDAIAQDLPFDESTREALVLHAMKGTMIRARLRSIVEKGHLRGRTMRDVSELMHKQGIDSNHYIQNDQFHFDPTRALLLLRFLSQGTWIGIFTGELFSADGQSAVPSELR